MEVDQRRIGAVCRMQQKGMNIVYFAKRREIKEKHSSTDEEEIHQRKEKRGKKERTTHEHEENTRKGYFFSPGSSGCSTLTPLDELTLRISLPSSANSLLRATFPAVSASRSAVVSGLSPSSTDGPAKSGFRNILRKASAMIAASAPDKGPPLSLVVDAASVARFLVAIDGETPTVAVGMPVWAGSGGLSYL